MNCSDYNCQLKAAFVQETVGQSGQRLSAQRPVCRKHGKKHRESASQLGWKIREQRVWKPA